jgi:hypothetical protein
MSMVVAALGMALVGCGSGSAGDTTLYPTIPVPTATASPRPTATPSGAAWTRVSASSGAAATMPASLRVIYDVTFGQSDKGTPPQFSLRRSDDFGGKWVNLSPPSIANLDYANDVSYAATTISPLNPQIAILTLQVGGRSGGCPLPTTSAIPNVCQAQFVTQDGGATWAPLRLPAPGLLGLINLFDGASRDNLTAQGARLYGSINDAMLASGGGNTPPGRLVVSDDGGATWRLVDSALATRNLLTYTYVAPASGSTVYMLAGATNAMLTPGELPPLSLWRSDNAGASWTQTGPLPSATFDQMLAASDAATGQTSLYVIASATPGSAPRLYASHDGAHTWTQCSQAPTNAGELLAALPTGSVLLDAASGVEEWDGSASVSRSVAQPTGLSAGPLATLQPQPDGSTRLWLSGGDTQGAVVEYATLRL